MNSYTVKLLVFFISLFILITVSSQIYLAFQDKVKTETAVLYSAVDKIDFKGVFIRNETPISYDGAGVISYPYPDGSKIAKNSAVAYVYGSESDINANKKIEQYTKEIEQLKKAQNKGTTQVAQPEFLSKLISQKYQEIQKAKENGTLNSIPDLRSELLVLMNINNIVIKKETDYNERIDYLNEQISSLSAQKTEPLQTIYASDSEYFASYTDGYEQSLKTENVDSITAAQIKEIISKDNSSVGGKNEIGKMIDGYKWKMVGVINNSQKYSILGKKVKLQLSSSYQPVYVTVDEIRETENKNESILVLSGSELTSDLVRHRVERAELILNNYEGIKIPRSAIRFRGTEKGVYIKLGEQIIFRKIDVIFETEDYVLSKNISQNGYLMLYDDIVTEGIAADADTGTDTSASQPGTSATESNSETTGSILIGGTTTAPAQTKSSQTDGKSKGESKNG
ncbi:MAG: hypothetical protein JG769_168 [Oscillospiraceae bacterium]|jgi:putative membrane fusion protein|nr:hypothetical protein [Oscillospiraceae bacterium]